MGILSRLLSWIHPQVKSASSDETFERLVWLDAGDSPFNVRVLDCRPVAETFISATENSRAIAFFLSPVSRNGEQFRGQHPENAIRVLCRLAYPNAAELQDGPVFLAEVMEDKWNIYHFDGTLYFVRSWTGQLHYVARLESTVPELRVREIEAWPGNVVGEDTMATRQVDFLLRNHLYGQPAPHPVPPLATKKGIALWSFTQYGRRSLFAAPEPEPTPR
jgi:hypothetical protein